MDFLHTDEVVVEESSANFIAEDIKEPKEGSGRFLQTTLDFSELERVQKEQGLVKEDVMNHLLFHKSLLGEEEHYERINKYIDIVSSIEKSVHLSMPNVYDQSIAITFELVMEKQLDPWDVDLVAFSKQYLKRAKAEGVDLVSAGRIILMAWTVLKLQSKDLLEKAEMPFDEPEDDYYMDDFDFDTEEDLDFTQKVLYDPEPPIKEMVWRKGKRPVTLIELVDAFEDARKAAELQKIIHQKREELRKRNLKDNRNKLDTRVHKDYLEEDIAIIWERISQFNGHPIPFTDICSGEKEDWIITLRSLLFLANRKWIKVWQKKFPFGEIYVKNLNLDGEAEKKETLEEFAQVPKDPFAKEEDLTVKDIRSPTYGNN